MDCGKEKVNKVKNVQSWRMDYIAMQKNYPPQINNTRRKQKKGGGGVLVADIFVP